MSHQARKRFGQNFLHDQALIERIIAHINPSSDDHVVEVGPGLGAITFPLLDRLQRLNVIEIDRDLVARLQRKNLPNLIIHESDVLKVDWQQLADGRSIRVVGNLPYNIGTPLLLNLLDQRAHVQDIHAMLQKEVVDRLSANSGTRAFGRLSVMMQSCFEIEPLLDVPPESFNPPPKVQSAVVRLVPRADAPDAQTIVRLSDATRLAFANKRKTLRNNLKSILSVEQLQNADLDPQARAETLSLDQFLLLAKMLP